MNKKILIFILTMLLFVNAPHVLADYCYCYGTKSIYSVNSCNGDECRNMCGDDALGNSNFKNCEIASPNTTSGVTVPQATTDPKSPPSSSPSAPVKLPNPLTGKENSKPIPELLGNIIQYAMGIIGSLALVMFIFGGVTWMLSAGNQERVTKGKNIIIWATMGLAIIFTAYALVRFVIETLGNSGGRTPPMGLPF